MTYLQCHLSTLVSLIQAFAVIIQHTVADRHFVICFQLSSFSSVDSIIKELGTKYQFCCQ